LPICTSLLSALAAQIYVNETMEKLTITLQIVNVDKYSVKMKTRMTLLIMDRTFGKNGDQVNDRRVEET